VEEQNVKQRKKVTAMSIIITKTSDGLLNVDVSRIKDGDVIEVHVDIFDEVLELSDKDAFTPYRLDVIKLNKFSKMYSMKVRKVRNGNI